MKYRADGSQRCGECSADPAPNRSRCEACLAVSREREAVRREKRKRAGQCVACGKRAVKGLTLCAEHREYWRARMAGA